MTKPSSTNDSPPEEPPKLQAHNKCDRESGVSIKSDGQSVIRERSASRDSVNDDPRSSFVDSISATSGRQNWSSIKDMAEEDPSISSIKGDSVSATIADYNRKHNKTTASLDSQSRASGRLGLEPSSAIKNDDSSVHINYFAASSSSATGITSTCQSTGDGHHNHNYHHNNNLQLNNNQNHHNQQRVRKHSRHRRNNSQQSSQNSNNSRNQSTFERSLEFDDLPQVSVYQIEPIVIRGNGNLTLFGLSNSFNTEFPQALLGRASREEFERTIGHINSLLRDQQSMSAKLLLFGSLFCCCSFGFSLVWPSIILKQRSKTNLEKFLANENQRLYSKLGLNWKLGQRCFNRFVEHVLIIEFNPKIDPYIPD